MSSGQTTFNEFQQGGAVTSHPTQPFLWSIRREFWEFRSIYIAPLGVALLVLFSFIVSMVRISHQAEPMTEAEVIQRPYNFAALFLMGICFVVSIFYCLEALSTERRDRSILFWKSLPISDFTTVLTKFSIPIVALPVIAVVLTIVTHVIMLLLNSAVLLASGQSVSMLWSSLPLGQMWMMQAYHMLVLHGLWFAPVYGWLLLMSAWAGRLAILWAVVPFVVIGVFEKMLFNSQHFGHWMMYRFGGAPASNAYPGGHMAMHAWAHLHLAEVLFNPSLWAGLIAAAVFLFLTARVRRSRGPI
jgi:ABC-2 type transport system permease protein